VDKAKILKDGTDQVIQLPKKFHFNSDEVEVREHPLGILVIDPKKRWNVIEEVMGSMSDDFFSEGLDDLPEDKRDDL
jgi:virulence-associated protein VagC